MRILSICTGAGLWDKVWVERGHEVIAGCEIAAHKRDLYAQYVGGRFRAPLLKTLTERVAGEHFDLITGGPPCQAHSKLRAIRDPKFPDLTNQVNALLEAVTCDAYLFENVAAIDIPGASTARLNAMHYPETWKGQNVHQSRSRWFTFSQNLTIPPPRARGTVDSLMAYSVVAGRIYGPKRGSVLQGHPEFASLNAPCAVLQEALADGIPRGLATAWAESVEAALCAKAA